MCLNSAITIIFIKKLKDSNTINSYEMPFFEFVLNIGE